MNVGDRVRLSASGKAQAQAAQPGLTFTEGTITNILSAAAVVKWDGAGYLYCDTADLELVPPASAFNLGDKVRRLSVPNGDIGEVIAIGCNNRTGQYEVRFRWHLDWYWEYELTPAPPAAPPNRLAGIYKTWIGPRSEDVKVKPYACDRCFGSKEIAVCMPCPKCC